MKSLLLLLLSFTLSPHPPPTLPEPPEKPAAEKQGLVITADTDVRLDGRPCTLADVPPGTPIATLDVAADKKTIIRLYFKSKEK